MNPVSRPILVAPDKFKGSLSAGEVAEAIVRGLARVELTADICRIADGGEGTLEILQEAGGGEIVSAPASDALGRAIESRFLLLDARTALIQSADVLGLDLIEPADRNPLGASSRGVGELIAAATASGVREVIVAIGGTATTDGGEGALDVLRERRLLGSRGPLKSCPKLTVLCDVRTAWEQAARIFAPQKGADRAQVEALSARLEALAAALPRDPRGLLMSGAGGGLAGGLWSGAGARLAGGAAWVLDRVDFGRRMLDSRAVITGEGSLDRQTLLGKAVGEVATRARQAGVPCHAIVGRMQMSAFDARILDFESVTQAGDPAAIADAASQLAAVLPRR